jgi:hypothetical protein
VGVEPTISAGERPGLLKQRSLYFHTIPCGKMQEKNNVKFRQA